MFKRLSWIRSRRKQLISLFIDSLIFLCFFKNNIFSLNIKLIILFTWISYSYIFGKYIFSDNKIVLILRRQILAFIFSSIFFTFLISFLSFFANDINFINLDLYRDDFLKIISISFIINLIVNLQYKTYSNNINRFVFGIKK